MKKTIALTLVFMLLVTLVSGCASTTTTPKATAGSSTTTTTGPAATTAGGKLKIAGVVFQDDEFMNMLTAGMKKAAAEEGVEIDTANTSSDQSKEVEYIDTYIAQKISGICIAPLDPKNSIATLKKAADAGLKITTVNMQLSDVNFLTGGYSSDDKANGEMIGKVAAEYIKAHYNREVKIAILDFDHQVPAQSKARYGGFLAALDAAGVKYKIVGQQSAEKEDNALPAAEGIINANPDVDIFYGSNSGGLIGAVNAIKSSSVAKTCKAFGYDGNDVITTMLKDSSDILQGVVVQDPFAQGYKAAKLLIATLKGTPSPIQGKTEVVPGIVLKRGDDATIAQYRKDNGFDK